MADEVLQNHGHCRGAAQHKDYHWIGDTQLHMVISMSPSYSAPPTHTHFQALHRHVLRMFRKAHKDMLAAFKQGWAGLNPLFLSILILEL